MKTKKSDQPKFQVGEELLRLEALKVEKVVEKGTKHKYFMYKLSDGQWYYEPDLMRLVD